MRIRPSAIAFVALVCAGAPLMAQTGPAGRAYFDSTLQAAGERLKSLPEIQALVADSGEEAVSRLLMPGGTLSFLPLSDSAVVHLLSLLNSTLVQLPESQCGKMLESAAFDGDGFFDWLALADRATVSDWIDTFMDLALLTLHHAPANPKPAKQEGERVIATVVTAMSPEEQRRLVTLNDGATAEDRCWIARNLFGGIGKLSEPEQVIALRAFFP